MTITLCQLTNYFSYLTNAYFHITNVIHVLTNFFKLTNQTTTDRQIFIVSPIAYDKSYHTGQIEGRIYTYITNIGINGFDKF